MYAVTKFPEEDGVEVVLLIWLTDGEKNCLSPQLKNTTKTTLAIKNGKQTITAIFLSESLKNKKLSIL